MSAHPPRRLDLAPSRSDRQALLVLACVWAAALGARAAGGLADPLATDAARVRAVAEHIDPNTASAASLRRLPQIGPTRAAAIVRYRQGAPAGRPAYRTADDLDNVPGIGPKTVDLLRPDLDLPADRPSGP